MDTEDDTIKIDGHRPTIELDVEIFADSASGGHAAVQVDEIEATVRGFGHLHRRSQVLRISYVAPDEGGADPDGQVLTGRLVEIGEDDLGPAPRQALCDGRPDAVTAAGDQGDAVLQLLDSHGVRSTGRSVDHVNDVHDHQGQDHAADRGVNSGERPALVVIRQPEPSHAQVVEDQGQHADRYPYGRAHAAGKPDGRKHDREHDVAQQATQRRQED